MSLLNNFAYILIERGLCSLGITAWCYSSAKVEPFRATLNFYDVIWQFDLYNIVCIEEVVKCCCIKTFHMFQ